jgi:hypothetical protein
MDVQEIASILGQFFCPEAVKWFHDLLQLKPNHSIKFHSHSEKEFVKVFLHVDHMYQSTTQHFYFQCKHPDATDPSKRCSSFVFCPVSCDLVDKHKFMSASGHSCQKRFPGQAKILYYIIRDCLHRGISKETILEKIYQSFLFRLDNHSSKKEKLKKLEAMINRIEAS